MPEEIDEWVILVCLWGMEETWRGEAEMAVLHYTAYTDMLINKTYELKNKLKKSFYISCFHFSPISVSKVKKCRFCTFLKWKSISGKSPVICPQNFSLDQSQSNMEKIKQLCFLVPWALAASPPPLSAPYHWLYTNILVRKGFRNKTGA